LAPTDASLPSVPGMRTNPELEHDFQMSTQNVDRASVRRGDGGIIRDSYELRNEVTLNGGSSTVRNASIGSAGGHLDYSCSGFIWRDPKPPFKEGVE